MARGGAAAIFAAGGFGASGGFPSGGGGSTCWIGTSAWTAAGRFCAGGGFPLGGGGGACCIGTDTGAEEGGVELVWIGGADKSVALNEGLAISPVNGTLCFPFLVVVGKEPGSAVVGLVCSKTEPVCGVWGWLGRPRDSFCVVVMIVRSVVSNNSLTWMVSSSSAGVLRSLGVWKLTGWLLRYTQQLFLLSYLISFPQNSAVPVRWSRLSTSL
jgi:hypothetical protein